MHSPSVTYSLMTSDECPKSTKCGKLVPIQHWIEGKMHTRMEPCMRYKDHEGKHDAQYLDPVVPRKILTDEDSSFNIPTSLTTIIKDFCPICHTVTNHDFRLEYTKDIPNAELSDRTPHYRLTCETCRRVHAPSVPTTWDEIEDERHNAVFLDGKHPNERNPENPKEWA